MSYRKEGKPQFAAAAKAGFSERSARYIEKRQHKEASADRIWRTREDSFEDVWKSELVPLLEKNRGFKLRHF